MQESPFSQDAEKLVITHGTKAAVEALVAKFAEKANAHERVEVVVWKDTDLYIEVVDTRLAYPEKHRACVTVDARTGTIKRLGEPAQYSFVRRGWKAFVTTLVGDGVSLYQG